MTDGQEAMARRLDELERRLAALEKAMDQRLIVWSHVEDRVSALEEG